MNQTIIMKTDTSYVFQQIWIQEIPYPASTAVLKKYFKKQQLQWRIVVAQISIVHPLVQGGHPGRHRRKL